MRIYDDPLQEWPRFAAAMAIAVGGAGGIMASVQTMEPWRFFGTAVFLAITMPLYIWKFHLLNETYR